MGAKDKHYDVVIVGAGISGCVLAERYASLGKKVLIIEKRKNIGGNCYDYYNKEGILVAKYGAHIFHTNHEDVWLYIQKFSEWYRYEHKVLSFVERKLVPIPVNITTVNRLYDLNLQSGTEMKLWVEKIRVKIKNPQNSEESAITRMGEDLYKKMFKNYTKKQWDMWPENLDASVMDRIPVRMSFDDRYFTDKYQALPEKGYTKFFEKMLRHKNITVLLNKDYFTMKNKLTKYKKLFFTGPIDRFFENKYEKLQYRSLRFIFRTYNKEYFQSNAVINYPNDYKFTRIVEYKHFAGQKSKKTTISREYSVWEGEPFYPVPSKRNKDLYLKYKKEAKMLEKNGIYFIGRLANYTYFNMDEAVKNALDFFNILEKVKKI